MKTTDIRVEVVAARPEAAVCRELRLRRGARVSDALEAAGLHSGLGDPAAMLLGIWGRRCGPDELLRDGDRVEIYRSLLADPKQARRERARQRARPSASPVRARREP